MSRLPLADVELVEPVAGGWQLVIAALLAIGLIVVLITWAKVHPFLALILGGLTVGIVAGQNINDVIESFSTGFGDTAAGVGALIALGAMFAKLLADSGGADQIVDTIVGKLLEGWPSMGHGRRGCPHRPADVLRDRPRAADAGHLSRGSSCPALGDHDRDPHARGSLRHARTGATAPRPADRHRHPGCRPRYDADARHPRRRPHRDRLRSGLRPLRRPLGRRGAPDAVRGSRGEGRRDSPELRHHPGHRAAAGRSDDGQGDRRHRRGRSRAGRADRSSTSSATPSSRC